MVCSWWWLRADGGAGGSPISQEDVLSSEIVLGAKGRPYYVYDLKVSALDWAYNLASTLV